MLSLPMSTECDRDALKTVATHSITAIEDKTQPAMDDVFATNSIKYEEKALKNPVIMFLSLRQAQTANREAQHCRFVYRFLMLFFLL